MTKLLFYIFSFFLISSQSVDAQQICGQVDTSDTGFVCDGTPLCFDAKTQKLSVGSRHKNPSCPPNTIIANNFANLPFSSLVGFMALWDLDTCRSECYEHTSCSYYSQDSTDFFGNKYSCFRTKCTRHCSGGVYTEAKKKE